MKSPDSGRKAEANEQITSGRTDSRTCINHCNHHQSARPTHDQCVALLASISGTVSFDCKQQYSVPSHLLTWVPSVSCVPR